MQNFVSTNQFFNLAILPSSEISNFEIIIVTYICVIVHLKLHNRGYYNLVIHRDRSSVVHGDYTLQYKSDYKMAVLPQRHVPRQRRV
jgi:hypothetical protein